MVEETVTMEGHLIDSDILRKAFDEAKVSAEIEVYKGANHGWMPPDSQRAVAPA